MGFWDDAQASWAQLWSDVDAGWQALYASGVKAYEDLVRSDPEKTAAQVQAFSQELEASRANLDRLQAAVKPAPRSPEEEAYAQGVAAMEARYQELASAFYADVQKAEGAPSVGFVPLLVVAGLAIGLGAATWSFAGYEYAVGLREQTDLAARELDARVEASREGRTLQTTTLPQAPAGEGAQLAQAGTRLVAVLLGGAAALAALTFVVKARP